MPPAAGVAEAGVELPAEAGVVDVEVVGVVLAGVELPMVIEAAPAAPPAAIVVGAAVFPELAGVAAVVGAVAVGPLSAAGVFEQP